MKLNSTDRENMTNQLELSEMKRAWIDTSIDRFFAMGFRQFSADDLHKILDAPPHDNWFGCMMASLRCRGKIREVGRVKSTRPERNGAKITLWETT